MENIFTKVDGTILYLIVDMAEKGTISTTGKSMVIAKTGSKFPVPVPGEPGVSFALTVIRSVQAERPIANDTPRSKAMQDAIAAMERHGVAARATAK